MDDQVEYVLSLSPEAFEGLIRDWLGSLGWRAVTTSRTGDGGVDVKAVNPDPIAGGKVVVQCKRYAIGNAVGVSTVREFYGVITHEGATRGLLITTSSFTKDAAAFAEGKRLALLNGAHACQLLEEAGLLGVHEPAEGEAAGPALTPLVAETHGEPEDDPAEAERIAEQAQRLRPIDIPPEYFPTAKPYRERLMEMRLAHLRSLGGEKYADIEMLTLEAIGVLSLAMSFVDEQPLERLAEAERFLQLAAARWPLPVSGPELWLLRVYLRWFDRTHDPHYLERAVQCLRYGRAVASHYLPPGRKDIFRACGGPVLGLWRDRLLWPSHFDDVMRGWGSADEARARYWGEAEARVATKAAECLATGKAALSARKWETAADNFEYLCRASPGEASQWHWLSDASAQAGRPLAALRAYAVYLALAPEADDWPRVDGFLLRGCAEVGRTWEPIHPSELPRLDGTNPPAA